MDKRLPTAANACRTLLGATLLLAAFLSGEATANVVSNSTYIDNGAERVTTGRTGPRGRMRMQVQLDLSGYDHAAVSFDFATLMRRNTSGFAVSSGENMRFRDGFHLISPIRSRYIRGDGGDFRRVGRNGFTRNGDRRRYQTAMFNLAQYDGQTVLLSLEYDARQARRRGIVNINNLRVDVQPANTPMPSQIPEPGTALLVVAGLLGLTLVSLRRRPAAGRLAA